MFNQFTHLVADASGWAYAVVFVFAFLDALLPVVPSETAVITAGVVAATGQLSLPLVLAAAACGAFAGDNTAYAIGHRFGPYAKARYFRGEKGRKTVRWTEHQLAERGGELIVVARFIPGGRIAVTLSAGAARYPWPRFALFDAIAGIFWAGYAALLGFFGGKAFERTPWAGLLLALAIAFAVTGALELGRAYLRRHRRPRLPDEQGDERPLRLARCPDVRDIEGKIGAGRHTDAIVMPRAAGRVTAGPGWVFQDRMVKSLGAAHTTVPGDGARTRPGYRCARWSVVMVPRAAQAAPPAEVQMAKIVHFEIPADDPQRAAAFYHEVLGWEASRFGEQPYWLLRAGEDAEPGANGALVGREDLHRSPVLIAGVTDVDDVLSRVQRLGGEVIQGKLPVPGMGWSAYIRDPEGNTVGFFQPDANAAAGP